MVASESSSSVKSAREKSTKPDGSPSLANSLLASVGASIVSQIICHPLDTCKARIQGPEGTLFKNTPQTMAKIIREEGWRALYGGYAAILWGGTPGYVLYLTSYQRLKEELGARWGNGASSGGGRTATHLAAGFLAEVVCCTVFVPVDVVKERMQVQRCPGPPGTLRATHPHPPAPLRHYRSSWDALRTIRRQRGLAGLYKGYGATLASYGPYSALYFAFYEKVKEKFSSLSKCHTDDLPYLTLLASSSIAAGSAAWITNPLDLVKLRLQVQRNQASEKETLSSSSASFNQKAQVNFASLNKQHSSSYQNFNYKNMVHGLISVYRQQGLRGMYKGSLARVIFEAPNMALGISLFDYFQQYLVSSC